MCSDTSMRNLIKINQIVFKWSRKSTYFFNIPRTSIITAKFVEIGLVTVVQRTPDIGPKWARFEREFHDKGKLISYFSYIVHRLQPQWLWIQSKMGNCASGTHKITKTLGKLLKTLNERVRAQSPSVLIADIIEIM